MDYAEELYGHPNQTQPSHIVITSPYFDTREVTGGSTRGGSSREERAYRGRVVVNLRDGGLSYAQIGEAIGVSPQAARKLYFRALQR